MFQITKLSFFAVNWRFYYYYILLYIFFMYNPRLSFHLRFVTAILLCMYNGFNDTTSFFKTCFLNPWISSLVRKLACFLRDTENTSSNSSNVKPFVSGRNYRTRKKPTMFQAAYHPNAPCDLNAFLRRGHVKANMKLKNQQVEVANPIPRSRMYKGNASAEYVNGIGPSPKL